MKKIFTISICLLLLLPNTLLAQNKSLAKINIALVGDLMPKQELVKIEILLKTFPNTTYEVVFLKELNQTKLKNFTHVWIHKHL